MRTGRGRDDDSDGDDDNYSFLRLKNWGASRILCVLGAAKQSKLKPDTIFERAGPLHAEPINRAADLGWRFTRYDVIIIML